jgi:pantothenate kinase type III
MNYLIGDIGNTLTKICLVNENSKILKEYNSKTKELFIKNNISKYISPLLKKKIKKKYFFQVWYLFFTTK